MLAEIIRVAKDLRNCDASYIGRVKRKHIVLIALTRSDEKPIALAEYRIGRQGQLGQLVESCNAHASAETRAHFHAMDAALEAWEANILSVKAQTHQEMMEDLEFRIATLRRFLNR
jgi:IMP cyclohydrolase